MSLANVLTYEQYQTQLAVFKAKHAEIKARVLELDAQADHAFELMVELSYAGIIYAALNETAYLNYCTYYVQAISNLFEVHMAEMIEKRQELNAINDQLAQLSKRWAGRFVR